MSDGGEQPVEGAAAELDLEARQLCDDGACTGVIGPDGACKECGRSAGPPDLSRPPPSFAGEATGAPDIDGDGYGELAEGAGFTEDRRLCPDGACTGLIGDEGRCKECGRAAE